MLLIIISISAFSQNKNFIDQPYLETSADVDTLVVPDRIFLNILITEKDTKGKTSVEELEKKMIASLKKLGIDTQKNLSLSDVASNFKKYFLKQQEVLKSKAYTIVVSDAPMVGQVILALEEIEISNVFLDKTEYSKIEQLKLELRTKAISKARLQAEYMVSPLNQKVGTALYIADLADNAISKSLQGGVSGIEIRGYGTSQKEKYHPADIEFEKIKVEAHVKVFFKLD